MLPRRSRAPIFVLLLAAASAGLASCGSGDQPTPVAAGGDPAAATSSASAPVETSAVVTTTVPDAVPTTIVAGPSGPSAASPVAGLDASELQAALAIPVSESVRSKAGPTVDAVALSDGTRVWRVRIPESFPARSARVEISVGGRLIGQAVLAPDLTAITAVTTDGTGLSAGSPVSYQWEGSPSVPAGNLEVAR